jgi:hypothetical protein
MMRYLIIVSSLAAVLSGCCTHQQPRTAAVKAKISSRCIASRSIRRRVSYQAGGAVRVADQVHVYRVGRLPDGDSMQEAGNYYHVEKSSYWNRFSATGRPVAISGTRVTRVPSETAAAKAYRVVPDDHELAELRNEAHADKEKAAEELAKAKLTRKKLEGLTQGLAQTDQVIKQAQTNITQLKQENDELRRRAATNAGGQVEPDFGKLRETQQTATKKPAEDALAQGPGNND